MWARSPGFAPAGLSPSQCRLRDSDRPSPLSRSRAVHADVLITACRVSTQRTECLSSSSCRISLSRSLSSGLSPPPPPPRPTLPLPHRSRHERRANGRKHEVYVQGRERALSLYRGRETHVCITTFDYFRMQKTSSSLSTRYEFDFDNPRRACIIPRKSERWERTACSTSRMSKREKRTKGGRGFRGRNSLLRSSHSRPHRFFRSSSLSSLTPLLSSPRAILL